jgi:phospholipid-binding lipoprotein MlaA
MKETLAAIALCLVAGCATVSGPPHPKDPWEGYNRSMFTVNDALDQAVLKPVAETYVKVVPAFAQEGVNNFFGNLEDLSNGINNILQGKVTDGFSDFARLAVNTVFGIAGLWDVATPMGLEKHNEDFGQTLGTWGMPAGPYFIIPFLGPSSVRDAPARYVDPRFFYNRGIEEIALRNTLFVTDVIRSRANVMKAEKVLDEAALDKYSFVRDAWLQRRQNQVYDGRPPRNPEDE